MPDVRRAVLDSTYRVRDWKRAAASQLIDVPQFRLSHRSTSDPRSRRNNIAVLWSFALRALSVE